MTRLPSLFALQAVEAAARRRSYSAAAKELGVTQGAISQQVRKLEAEFGTQLFLRRGNEMIPTANAARLGEEVRLALTRLGKAIASVGTVAEQDPLVMSMDSRFASRWMAPRLARLMDHTASAHVEIRVEDRVANFAKDGVDVGIRMGRGDWLGLEARRLTTERLCIICTPQFAEEYRIRSVADLAAAPLIDNTDHLWTELFGRHALSPPTRMNLISDSTVVVVDAVLRHLGAGIVRYSMVESDLRTGRLVRPVRDLLSLPINFVYGPQLVRPVRDGEPEPAPLGYFVVWRPENRKQYRIQVLCDWLSAEAEASESELG
jgi:LysR family glycine cleavage system transcriptional activator